MTLQPSGIFVTDVESLAHHHHRRGLSAVTFVPEWNSLIVSVLLFSSSSPSGLCPAWMPLLTFTPTAVRPSRAFSSAITAAMLTFGTAGWQSDVDASVSAVNKTPGRRTLLQAVSVQSINFQDKHQKEKILFFPHAVFAERSCCSQRPTRRARSFLGVG